MRSLTCALVACVAVALGSGVSASAQAVQATGFDAAQLEQLVAPVALYPDTVLTQVFMAATYPTEVVEADRFMRANPSLSGASIESALLQQSWDPSVKALCGTREVLERMSANLGWTRDLGEAFLGQRTELFDTVQRMRARAQAAGSLATTPQQVVTVRSDRIIEIACANPEIVYIPTYSPIGVYGGWGYPRYYYPGLYSGFGFGVGFGGGGLTFGLGFGWGWGSWGQPNWAWGGSDVYINVDRYNRFNSFGGSRYQTAAISANQPGGYATWQHNPAHRGGVAYRQPTVAQQYSGVTPQRQLTRDQARGFQRPAVVQPVTPGRTTNRTPGVDRSGVGRTDTPVGVRPTQRPVPNGQPSNPARPTQVPRTEPARPAPTQRPVPDAQPSNPARPTQVPRNEPARPAPTVRPVPNAQPSPAARPQARPSGEAPHSVFSGSRAPALDRAATNRGFNSRGVPPPAAQPARPSAQPARPSPQPARPSAQPARPSAPPGNSGKPNGPPQAESAG